MTNIFWFHLPEGEDLLLSVVLHCEMDKTNYLETSPWALGSCDEPFPLFSDII